MSVGLVVSISSLLLAGFLLVKLVWPAGTMRPNLALTTCFATGAGAGVVSVTYLISLALAGGSRRSLLVIEALLFLVLGGAVLWRGTARRAPDAPAVALPPPPSARLSLTVAGGCVLALIC